MSFAETLLLAAIAGFTIYAGLPLARMETSPRTRVVLAMFSVGILAFLLVDVLGHGYEETEGAVEAFGEDEGSFGHALALTLLLLGGFTTGSLGIGLLERRIMGSRKDLPPMAGGEAGAVADDVLAATDDFRHHEAGKRALTTGLFIAAAIGLHNFAEGLAIGVSAGSDEIALATVLVIGFALHNATEGFGIIGPLGNVRPSWGWLGLAGLIAGLPVVIGASIGYSVESEPLEIAFYGLAGGAILYVIGEIWQGVRRYGHKELGLLLLAAGFSAGVLTDFVIAYAGG
jgi:zinc transporter, ZIP family